MTLNRRMWDATDERFVRGQGRYIGDMQHPQLLHACFVRSWVAHGTISEIDTGSASAQPGVVGVWTAADLRDHLVPLEVEGACLAQTVWRPLAADRVRFVGEPLAVVVAESRQTAEDAAEAIVPEIEPLDPITSVEKALAEDAPRLFPELNGNVYFSMSKEVGEPDAAFKEADVIIERVFTNGRQTPFPLEGRGALAELVDGRIELTTSTQIPHIVQEVLSRCLRRSPDSVRVITPDVGGGFGLKLQVFGEEIVLGALGALLDNPIKWVEDRHENLMGSAHSHDQRIRIKLAGRADGTILAIDADVTVDAGAHSVYPLTAGLDVATTASRLFSAYAFQHARLSGKAVGTNKAPVGAYRGVGFSAAVFATERMMDLFANEVGIDRYDLRLQGLVKPEDIPYDSPTGGSLDAGDYPTALRTALHRLRGRGWFDERAKPPSDGNLLGIGLVVFNELTGPGSKAYRSRGVTAIPGNDAATAGIERNGSITVRVSSAEAGQRHRESYRMILSERFGLPPGDIEVVEGDTDRVPPGSGTFASRASTSQMTCVSIAGERLLQSTRALAGTIFGCGVDSVIAKEGSLIDVNSGCSMSLREFAACLQEADEPLPESTAEWDGEAAYSYGVHACLVDVDPATLSVTVRDYVSVEDCGRIISHAGVTDQLVGGVAMGIGCALLEECIYDEYGQLQTATMLDYLLPLASAMPMDMDSVHVETPTPRTPLGAKGMGEAGTIGAVGAIGCAVADAVARRHGAELNSLPATPQRIFDALEPTSRGSLGSERPGTVDRG